MKLLSVGLNGAAGEVRARLQNDCRVLAQEGFRVAFDEINRGRYTFLGCNIVEGELSFRNYERIKGMLKTYVARILTDVIVQREEKALVNKIIATNYYYFNEDERKAVFNNVLEMLNSAEGINKDFGVADRRNRVLMKILEYLDSHHELVLEGFLNFRLKEYRKKLEVIVDKAVDDFMLELEYKEFVRVLKYFVEMKDSRLDEVHVGISGNGAFKIMDSERKAISNRYVDSFITENTGELNYDDLLLSALISMAPGSIILHDVKNAKMIEIAEIVKGIFPDRVVMCNGCDICTIK